MFQILEPVLDAFAPEIAGVISDALISRAKAPFKMLIEGQLRSVPSQLNFLKLMLSIPRMIGSKKEGRTVAEYYSRIVGRSNYDRVLSPLLAASMSACRWCSRLATGRQ